MTYFLDDYIIPCQAFGLDTGGLRFSSVTDLEAEVTRAIARFIQRFGFAPALVIVPAPVGVEVVSGLRVVVDTAAGLQRRDIELR